MKDVRASLKLEGHYNSAHKALSLFLEAAREGYAYKTTHRQFVAAQWLCLIIDVTEWFMAPV